MKRKLICTLLSVVLLLTLLPFASLHAEAASDLSASEDCIGLLKQMEGFSAKPYWDYLHYSVGYGTACPSEEDRLRYEAEGISEEEATQLLNKYVNISEKHINRFADKNGIKLEQRQFDALILFTYNCGTSWMHSDKLLCDAVINGDTGSDFLYAFCGWCNAGGRVQRFLLDRRLKEANVYLNGVYSIQVPAEFGYVIYNGNGGAISSKVQGYALSDPAELASTATSDNKEFAGWFTAKDGGNKVDILDESVRGMTLYAHWNVKNDVTLPVDPETTDPEESQSEETKPENTNPVKPQSVDIEVTGDYVNVRTDPGTDSEIVGSVNSGKKITVTETAQASGYHWGKFEDGWICLQYTNYDDVVNQDIVTPEPPETSDETITGTIDANWLRIRSGAGTSYAIVGYLNSGAVVEITEQKMAGDMMWGKIDRGWISMDYVKVEEPEPEIDTPVPEPDPAPLPEPERPHSELGVVNTDNLRIRSNAGLGNSVLGYLNTGDRVEILERTTASGMEWGKIDKGWISLDYVDFVSDDNPEQGNTAIDTGIVVDTNSLRVRSAAGLGNSVLGYLTMNTRVEIYEKMTVDSMIWGRIDQGWISLNYIRLDSNQSEGGTTRVVDTSCLRIRSGAGLNNQIVGYLYMGDKVEILESTMIDGMPWGKTNRGWISLDYVI